MLKYLSNAFVLLFIIIHQLLFAQLELLKNSGALDQACQKGIGPWYFASNYTNGILHNEADGQYELFDLNSKKISLIDRDGVVCFCEGESEFSGLVTANNVTLYGNGAAERVIVSPSLDNYFNLIFLDNSDLLQFSQYYPFILKDDDLSISNGKEDLELSIKNITFTNSLTRNESQNWLQKYAPTVREINDQLIENVNCLKEQFSLSDEGEGFSWSFDEQAQECFSDDQMFISKFSQSSIQGNRPNTTLALENVIFKEINNDMLIEFFSNEGIATFENIQLVQNRTLGGMLIEGTRTIELSNVKADQNFNTTFIFIKNQNVSLSDVSFENSRNWSGLVMMGNYNQSLSKIKAHRNEFFTLNVHTSNLHGPIMIGEGKLTINDFEVSDSQIQSIFLTNQKLKAENTFFKNNKWDIPFLFSSSDQNPFKFSGLVFENNRPGVEFDDFSSSFFTIAISGFGSLNNFTFADNEINFPMMINSSKMIFNRSLFIKNTINGMNDTYNPLILQIGNVEYINTQFLNNNFQWATDKRFQGQEVVIIPRFIFYEGNELAISVLRENRPNYSLLMNHKISMKNVRMNHSENVASILAINADNITGWSYSDAERANPNFFQLGAENGDFTIYKFQEVDNIECAFEDVYRCR